MESDPDLAENHSFSTLSREREKIGHMGLNLDDVYFVNCLLFRKGYTSIPKTPSKKGLSHFYCVKCN